MSEVKLGNKFVLKSIESYVKTALVFLIIYACFMIFKPFMLPVIWGIVIAVALYPVHLKLTKLVKKSGLASGIITITLLAILIVPSFSFSSALVDSVRELTASFEEGTLVIPPPADNVAEWPLIGKKTHAIWQTFSDNTVAGLEKYNEEVKNIISNALDHLIKT
jgi:predicted PurR-regulated permease PerM